MPISWDANMDRKLFLAIFKIHNISVDAEAVAKELATEEQPCTAVAIKKRLAKIKTQIKEEGNGASCGETPRKRGAARSDGETPAKKGKKTSGKGDKIHAAGDDGGGDDEEVLRSKVEVKKEEGLDAEEDDI